jgi:hypothetical protein
MIRSMATLAFCLGSLGMMSTARAASFDVMIDCHGTGGVPSWAHTPNIISVFMEIDGSEFLLRAFTVPASACDQEDEIWIENIPGVTGFDVDRLIVRTNGSNTFWIDQMKLIDDGTGTTWTWGVDNTVGYCVSTSADAGSSPHCTQGVAVPNWFFPK